MIAHDIDNNCHQNNGNQRTRNLFRKFRCDGDNHDTGKPDQQRPEIYRVEMFEIGDPFRNEIRRDLIHCQPEKVFHLRGKNSESDTTGETDDDRVRNELDNRP